ncbi:hypothetical protein MHYP_G00354650 [Metynnis hypsauchen]
MNFVDNLNKWASRVDMDYGNKLNQALSSSSKFLPTAGGPRGAAPFQHYGRPLGHGVKVKEEDESVEDFFHFAQHLQQQTGECLTACCGGANPKTTPLSASLTAALPNALTSPPPKPNSQPSAERPYHCQDCGNVQKRSAAVMVDFDMRRVRP